MDHLPTSHGSFHSFGDGHRILMFPRPNDDPSVLSKPTVELAVAGYVSIQFGHPVIGIPGRRLGVLRALMPVATIDEHSHLCAGEHDICSPAQALQGLEVDPIAKPLRVKDRTQPKLWFGVPPTVGLHVPPPPWAGRPGCGGSVPFVVYDPSPIMSKILAATFR